MNPPQKYLLFHLPKTGGTTIYKAFKQWVGPARFETYRRKFLPEALNGIRPETLAINGHFDYTDLTSKLDLEEWRIIVWLRHPVDRVISNYHHFIRSIHNPPPEARDVAKQNAHRLHETLLEYCGHDGNKNLMSTRLRGAKFEDFYFIGQQERLEDDLKKLAAHIGMPVTEKVPYSNTGEYTRPSAEALAQLHEWNHEDLAMWAEWTLRIKEQQRS